MSKLAKARELIQGMAYWYEAQEKAREKFQEFAKQMNKLDLSDETVNPDEKAMQAFEDAVCYEIQVRKEKIGKNMTDDLINAVKRIRRQKDEE